MNYRCPLCGREIARNLVLFLSHGEQHIIDQIKEEHPEWVEADGVCRPCAEYYRKQLSGELASENIGPGGRKWRTTMGVAMLGASLGLALVFVVTGVGRPWRLLTFVPVFSGFLGLIQAREKTCAVLAELGVRDVDTGQRKIEDVAVAARLKARGRWIVVKATLWAAGITLAFLFYP